MPLPEPECVGCVHEGYPLIECPVHGISCDVPGCTLYGQHEEHDFGDKVVDS